MLLPFSTNVELDTATYNIPPGTQHPEFVVPLEVTDFIIKQYGLDDPLKRIADLYAGNADFLERVRNKGGRCSGIELDPQQFEFANNNLPPPTPIVVHGVELFVPEFVQGDCTETTTPIMALGHHALFTSWPFTLVDQLVKPPYWQRDLRFARAFNLMLLSDGVLIIDSADHAERNGQTLTPAADTVEYLVNPSATYSQGYFNLVASHRFKINNAPPGCDGQFTELVFTKRWPYYHGALADVAMLHTVERQG